jgi:putative PEP-CTERM system TPR-repeat lipoprotein
MYISVSYENMLIWLKRVSLVSCLFLAFFLKNSGVLAQQNSRFDDVQTLIDNRQFDEAISRLNQMSLDGKDGAEKYRLLSIAYLETGAGIAAQTAIERARALGADYAVTAVPFAKALLVQRKYTDALATMRGVRVPADMIGLSLIVSGDANFALGNYEKAKQDYEEALRSDDSSFQPYLGLARLELRQENIANAKVLAEQALERDASNTMVQYTLGLIGKYTGDFEKAEQYFERALELFPGNIVANIELAAIRINQNKLLEAEVFLDRVYESAPGQPMALYLSAVILASKQEYQEADLLLKRARVVTESYLPAIYVRGMVSFQLGDFQTAAGALETVLNVRPANREARLALAATYMKQERARTALRLLGPLLSDESLVDATVLSMAATAALSAGEAEQGRKLLERVAAAKAEQNGRAVRSLGSKLALALYAEGDTEGALQAISNVSAGKAAEIRELGLMASMQIREGDDAGAKTTANRIISTAPERALGYNMLGTIAYRAEDYETAAQAYTQALDRNPDYYSALRNRGLARYQLGQLNRAEDDLRRLVDLQPNDFRSQAVLGRILLAQEEFEDAVVFFKEAARALPNSVPLAADYSKALAGAGNTTKAIEQARYTARKAADRPQFLKEMGVLLLRLGQPQAAERPLSRHVAFYPSSGEAHLLHGRALLRMGLYTGAKISFERAERASEDQPDAEEIAWFIFAANVLGDKQSEALAQLDGLVANARPTDVSAGIVGDLLLKAGRLAAAEQAYRSVFDDEKSAAVAIGLARTLSAQNKAEESVRVLLDFVAEYPNNRFVRTELGARYEAAGNFEEAALHYRRILQNGAADARSAARLASVYLELNNNQSIPLAERAYLIAPEDPYILDVYGWVLLQAGRNFEKSVPALEKAARRAPANATYKYHLGMAYIAMGRRSDARKSLQQAIGLDPSFPMVDEAKRQLASLNR